MRAAVNQDEYDAFMLAACGLAHAVGNDMSLKEVSGGVALDEESELVMSIRDPARVDAAKDAISKYMSVAYG